MKNYLFIALLLFSNELFPAQFAYITNSAGSTVSVVNTDTNMLTATINVGQGPTAITINPTGTKAYVANSGSDTVSVIDTAANIVTATINVGTRPRGITINPEGTKVYVANYGKRLSSNYVSAFDKPGNVSVIDTSKNTVIGNNFLYLEPTSIAISPDGKKGFILDSYSIPIFDTANNTKLDELSIRYPQKLVFDKTGNKLYVANWEYGLSIIDMNDLSKIDIGGWSYNTEDVAINSQGTKAYVVNTALSVIDTENNSITSTIDVGNFPMAIAVNQAGTKVFVTNAGNNNSISSNNNVGNLLIINAENNNIIATVKVGKYPNSIALTPATPIISNSALLSCVFDWLEFNYPQYYAPANKNLLKYGENSYRYYTSTDSLIVYSPSDDILYSGYGTSKDYQYINIGLLKNWKSALECDKNYN